MISSTMSSTQKTCQSRGPLPLCQISVPIESEEERAAREQDEIDALDAVGDYEANTERLNSPWCNRGHFAVATFLHREVFKTAQRREWHVDVDKKTLRHMTRGRVLRLEAELHDGQRIQIFNVHQATSGDIQLQQHTWQILAKSVGECKHQRILLGGEVFVSRHWC
jgi:hypothetical protein